MLKVIITLSYIIFVNWSFTLTLTWQNSNLTKIEWERVDEEGSSAGTKTFTHDDKKTPFYHCNIPKWALWWLSYDWIYVDNDMSMMGIRCDRTLSWRHGGGVIA